MTSSFAIGRTANCKPRRLAGSLNASPPSGSGGDDRAGRSAISTRDRTGAGRLALFRRARPNAAALSRRRGPVGDDQCDREADPTDEDRRGVVEDDAEAACEGESNEERRGDDHAATSSTQLRESYERGVKIF